jgi:ABC-2 type transport system permease protein
MKKIIPLYQKELKDYFYSISNYIFALLFVLVSFWLFFQNFFIQRQAQLSSWTQNLPFLLLFFIPALSMGILSEERKSGTWEVILSLPINETHIVIAKFLASFTFLLIVFLTTLSLPTTLIILGRPDIGIITSNYLGVILLSSAYLSFGIFISSLTRQQTVSFMLSFILLLINDILAQNFFLMRLPPIFKTTAVFLSLRAHYETITKGLISLSDISFFISWIVIFIILSIIAIRSRDY